MLYKWARTIDKQFGSRSLFLVKMKTRYPVLGDVLEEVCPVCHLLGISSEPQELSYVGPLGNGVKKDYFKCPEGHRVNYSDIGFAKVDIRRKSSD